MSVYKQRRKQHVKGRNKTTVKATAAVSIRYVSIILVHFLPVIVYNTGRKGKHTVTASIQTVMEQAPWRRA